MDQPNCPYYLCTYPDGECAGLCPMASNFPHKRNEYLLDEYRSGLDSPPDDGDKND